MTSETTGIIFCSVDANSISDLTARLLLVLPGISKQHGELLAHAAIRFQLILHSVANRKIFKQHAGRKPCYATAMLLADIVALGVVDEGDLIRMGSGSYWEGRATGGALSMTGACHLEIYARGILLEMTTQESKVSKTCNLQRPARNAKKFLHQIMQLRKNSI